MTLNENEQTDGRMDRQHFSFIYNIDYLLSICLASIYRLKKSNLLVPEATAISPELIQAKITESSVTSNEDGQTDGWTERRTDSVSALYII